MSQFAKLVNSINCETYNSDFRVDEGCYLSVLLFTVMGIVNQPKKTGDTTLLDGMIMDCHG